MIEPGKPQQNGVHERMHKTLKSEQSNSEADCTVGARGPIMKIKKVSQNNRKRAFEVATYNKCYLFPYAKLDVRPSRENPIKRRGRKTGNINAKDVGL